jgi:hypothetical protein
LADNRLPKDRALAKLREQLAFVPSLRQRGRFSPEFQRWHRDTQVAIERIFGKDAHHLKEFQSIEYSLSIVTTGTPDSAFESAFRDGLVSAVPLLESFIGEVQEYWSDGGTEPNQTPSTLARLSTLCLRFHLVVRQLQDRHAGRLTFEVEDEYDVQDLVHSLLHLEFDDIRREEWVPSYAGGASRVDLLLKNERVLFEVKKTRKGLSARDLGDQLIIDTQRYQTHPNCDHLFCFVYDPEGRVGNPRGFEADLSGLRGTITVQVVVTPRGG